jgi:hypothetical protein
MISRKLVFFIIIGLSLVIVIAIFRLKSLVTFPVTIPRNIQVVVKTDVISTATANAPYPTSSVSEVEISLDNPPSIPEPTSSVSLLEIPTRELDSALIINAAVTPKVTKIGSTYQFKFVVTNNSTVPVKIESVSAETYLNATFLRSTPHYFNAKRHGQLWYSGNIEPGQTKVVYNGTGVRTIDVPCGDYYAILTFHTSIGDFEAVSDYTVKC